MSKLAKARSAPAPWLNIEIVCTICVDTLAEGIGKKVVVTECGHPYHESCLDQWIRQPLGSGDTKNILTGYCPVCTTKICMVNCRQIFLTAETKLVQTVTLEEFNQLKAEHYKLLKEHRGCPPPHKFAQAVPSAVSKRLETRNAAKAKLTKPVPSTPTTKPIPSKKTAKPMPSKPTTKPVPSKTTTRSITLMKTTKSVGMPVPKPSSSKSSSPTPRMTTRSAAAAVKASSSMPGRKA